MSRHSDFHKIHVKRQPILEVKRVASLTRKHTVTTRTVTAPSTTYIILMRPSRLFQLRHFSRVPLFFTLRMTWTLPMTLMFLPKSHRATLRQPEPRRLRFAEQPDRATLHHHARKLSVATRSHRATLRREVTKGCAATKLFIFVIPHLLLPLF